MLTHLTTGEGEEVGGGKCTIEAMESGWEEEVRGGGMGYEDVRGGWGTFFGRGIFVVKRFGPDYNRFPLSRDPGWQPNQPKSI